MSGHSKWSTIKRDKAINDAKRSKVFTKYSRLITLAAKRGGKDPAMNSSLRLAIEKAKEARVPKENIERAIEKGIGGGEGSGFEEVTYEGYGPGGIALLIKGVTDNKNRTISEVRNIFSRHGGSLGESGSAKYVFADDPENPIFHVSVDDKNLASKLFNLVDELDDCDDINDVYANFEISESILKDLEASA